MGDDNDDDGIPRRRLLLLFCYCDCDDCDRDYQLRSCHAGEDDTRKKSKMLRGIATLIPNAGRRVLQKG